MWNVVDELPKLPKLSSCTFHQCFRLMDFNWKMPAGSKSHAAAISAKRYIKLSSPLFSPSSSSNQCLVFLGKWLMWSIMEFNWYFTSAIISADTNNFNLILDSFVSFFWWVFWVFYILVWLSTVIIYWVKSNWDKFVISMGNSLRLSNF